MGSRLLEIALLAYAAVHRHNQMRIYRIFRHKDPPSARQIPALHFSRHPVDSCAFLPHRKNIPAAWHIRDGMSEEDRRNS